jgi:HEAT repeat protein
MDVRQFVTEKPAEQVHYLKSDTFTGLEPARRIDFLKEILLREKVSTKTMAAALKLLRELRYRDNLFFRKFLYHPDSSITMAAKKAMQNGNNVEDSGFHRLRDMVRSENREKRLEAIQRLIDSGDPGVVDLLLSFLNEDNMSVKAMLVRELSGWPELDERKLLTLLPRAIWHVRAALVEILGNRRSESLYDLLKDLIVDVNVEVRLKLIEAMTKLSRERVMPYLQRLTTDPHIRVKREALRALARD